MDTLNATSESVKTGSDSGRDASPSPAASPSRAASRASSPSRAAIKKQEFYREFKDLKDSAFIAVGDLKSRHRSVTDDAVIAAVIDAFSYSSFADDWIELRHLFAMLRHFNYLGPVVIENTLNAMARIGEIDLWWDLGSNKLPPHYDGERPRSGLFRIFFGLRE
jgi:hypothetical protein